MRVTAYLPVNNSRKAKDTTLRSPARFGDKGLLTSAVCAGVTRPLACVPFKVNPKSKPKPETEKQVGFILSQVSTANQLEKKIDEERNSPVIENAAPPKRAPLESQATDIGAKRQRRPPKNIFDR